MSGEQARTKKKGITGILFDLDGTLIDSETSSYEQMITTVGFLNDHAAPVADQQEGTAQPQALPLVYSLDIHRGIIGTGSTVWPRLIYDRLGVWYSGAAPTVAGKTVISQEDKDKHTKWVWKTTPPISDEHISAGEALPLAGNPVTPEDFTAMVHAIGIAKGFDVPMMPGVLDFFNALKAHPELSKIPLSIATSSRRKYATLKIEGHAGTNAFPQPGGTLCSLTCGSDEEVGLCKPAPDIFLVAEEKVRQWRKENGKAEQKKEDELFVVFEDSPSGVKAAHDAGCYAIVLVDPKFNDGSHEWMKLADSVLVASEGNNAIMQSIPVLESLGALDE